MKKDYDHDRMRSGRESIITMVYRPFVESIAKVIFKTNITPNQMTTMGILISLVGGVFFALGEWKYLIIGAVLVQLVLISDMLDGKIARYKNLKSLFGEWYDGIANKIFKYFLFFGATIGVYRTSGNPLILIVGAVAIFNVTMIAFILYIKQFSIFSKGHTELPRIKGFEIPFGLLTLVGLSIFALFNVVGLFLWIFATFGTLAWIKQIHSCYRLGKKHRVKT